eukprot:CAMPEP_0198444238 /NCGR_PEP_ID=MMETSP1452-20131203/70505_1 /TAXON_ID=1181717 /ORGANISM="Synchroma pusillum, Strain CCMP3072" /LENGTH=281 /DNA_ID=CAMNT_0044164893 /DNA_START=1 /DNA_END=842 /DNA_ORIENTATION=+
MEQVAEYKAVMEAQGWAFNMTVSFLEIYNEKIRCLLGQHSEDVEESKHEIKRDVEGKLYVTDLRHVPVDPADTDQVEHLMNTAARHRSVARTDMNARSSRSHSVFTLNLTARNEAEGTALRLARSGATGDRAKEAMAINKSLSALADVFVAIGNKQRHIPFRNSKLTHLLMPALSGDGKTLMMVNVSPTKESFGETLSTLRFAQTVNQVELGRAKKNVSDMADADAGAGSGASRPLSAQSASSSLGGYTSPRGRPRARPMSSAGGSPAASPSPSPSGRRRA